jgi:hypothetical protein
MSEGAKMPPLVNEVAARVKGECEARCCCFRYNAEFSEPNEEEGVGSQVGTAMSIAKEKTADKESLS